MIRKLKPAYALYNFFHKKLLKRNVPLYKKAGVNKKYYSTVSSKDFENVDPSILTQEDIVRVDETSLFGKLNPSSQSSLLSFQDNGYAIVTDFIKPEVVETINTKIQDLLSSGSIDFKYGNKLMFVINKSPLLKGIWTDPALIKLLDSLILGKAQLFQSINFLTGSEQKTHSDSIHMTTFPLGGLLGVWLALEDIDSENGPLHYYPGSHLLPYYLNSDYDNEGSQLMLGKHTYQDYEKMIEQKIQEKGLEKKTFQAKKGDLLIWHANLFHGGNPHLDKQRSRKSMVLHYFDANRICYHEITQRPALLAENH